MGSDGMIVCSSWAGPPEPTGWDGHLLKKNKVRLRRMPGRTVVRQNPWVFAGLGGHLKISPGRKQEPQQRPQPGSLLPILSPGRLHNSVVNQAAPRLAEPSADRGMQHKEGFFFLSCRFFSTSSM